MEPLSPLTCALVLGRDLPGESGSYREKVACSCPALTQMSVVINVERAVRFKAPRFSIFRIW